MERMLGCFNQSSQWKDSDPSTGLLCPVYPRDTWEVGRKWNKRKMGVEGSIDSKLRIVLMPWKILGLVGLGPKAWKHSQNTETCYTYNRLQGREKLSVLRGLHC